MKGALCKTFINQFFLQYNDRFIYIINPWWNGNIELWIPSIISSLFKESEWLRTGLVSMVQFMYKWFISVSLKDEGWHGTKCLQRGEWPIQSPRPQCRSLFLKHKLTAGRIRDLHDSWARPPLDTEDHGAISQLYRTLSNIWWIFKQKC